MSAVASAWWLASTHTDQVSGLGGFRALLQRCVLQQYLKWAHNQKCEDGRGALFQGFGAFTKDFLIPCADVNAVGKKFPDGKNMFTTSTVFGPWWPTDAFVAFAEDYFAGKFGFPSWGNGAVMSFAPHPIAAASWWPAFTPKGGLSGHAEVLSGSHRSPLAKLGAVLLHEVLSAIYSGSLSETKCIPAVVGGLSGWKAVVREFQERPHECFPIDAFSEWLKTGRCT